MPLIQTLRVEKNTQVSVWHITEDERFLKDITLNENSQLRLNGMKSESHRKGFLAVRHLLVSNGYSDSDLHYNKSGKPLLKNGLNISISHSFDYSCIIISDQIVGIDIEKNRDKILRIAHRFIGIEKIEYENTQEQVKMLTKIWAIKESLFKTRPEGNILFKDHLFVNDFSIDDSSTKAQIIKHGTKEIHDAYFMDFPNYSLAYTIKSV